MQLSKVIFWDTAYEVIDWDNKARFVIGRVLMYGTIADWNTIKAYYGLERIKQEMLHERYLDKKTLSFFHYRTLLNQGKFFENWKEMANPFLI